MNPEGHSSGTVRYSAAYWLPQGCTSATSTATYTASFTATTTSTTTSTTTTATTTNTTTTTSTTRTTGTKSTIKIISNTVIRPAKTVATGKQEGMILTSEQYRLMQKRSMTVEEMGRAGGKQAKFSKVSEYRPSAPVQDSRHPAIPSSITVRKVMGKRPAITTANTTV
ncbi:uncharacterized protein LOC133395067 [Anopheles gambiae]|uniref:uncharacterized protein LOC133395067 n=1 Tax=Anopheles gambiae TaxID=7165 RepID=UPI002AC95A21|nr:uncharacterized protein LOC133395067 [Anopheles gambiae]